MKPETQLFILWEKARYQQEKILADMRERFSIVKQYEITWTPELVSSNYTRFYGENLPDHSEKEQECGTGAFLLVIVRDEFPHYEYRVTSHGIEWINTKMFDAKQLYREWTNGGHKIHCSNTVEEFNHDITLLLGINAEDFQKQIKSISPNIERLHKDIVGCHGWNSIDDLLYVLNSTVTYAIMRGGERLLSNVTDSEHEDIDVLLTKRQSAIYIINGVLYCCPERPHILVTIDDNEYIFDLWEYDHGVYDPCWERQMLANRVKRDGYYVLSEQDDFYSLLYHCIVTKNNISEDYRDKLCNYCDSHSIKEKDWSKVLVNYLSSQSYVIPMVNDAGVSVHTDDRMISEYANKNGHLRKRLCEEVEGKLYLSAVYEKEKSYVKKGTAELIGNEMRFLESLQDYSNFPHILAFGEDNGEKWMEISKVLGTNLEDFFQVNYKHNNVSFIRSFIEESIKILIILRDHNIVHRDFIPSNILVSHIGKKCKVGLIDFGWSVFRQDLKNSVTPPFLGGEYAARDKSSDEYAFSCIICQMWNRIPAIRCVANQLQNKVKLEDINVHFSLNDYWLLYLMRHKRLDKWYTKIRGGVKKIKRKMLSR